MDIQGLQHGEHVRIDRIASDEERYYVGSKKRRKFHRPQCDYAIMIPESMREYYDSHREAVESGRKPCGQCCA